MNPAKLAGVVDALKLKGERVNEVEQRLRRHVATAGNVDEPDIYFSLWDFAGQSVYYITHQVCVTRDFLFEVKSIVVCMTGLIMRTSRSKLHFGKFLSPYSTYK